MKTIFDRLPEKPCRNDLSTILGRIKTREYDIWRVDDDSYHAYLDPKKLAQAIEESTNVVEDDIMKYKKDIISILRQDHEPIVNIVDGKKFTRHPNTSVIMELHKLGFELYDLRKFFQEHYLLNDEIKNDDDVEKVEKKLIEGIAHTLNVPSEMNEDLIAVSVNMLLQENKYYIKIICNANVTELVIDSNDVFCKTFVDWLVNFGNNKVGRGSSMEHIYAYCVIDFLMKLNGFPVSLRFDDGDCDFMEDTSTIRFEEVEIVKDEIGNKWWELPLASEKTIDCDLVPQSNVEVMLYDGVEIYPGCSLYVGKLDYGEFFRFRIISNVDNFAISKDMGVGEIICDNSFTRCLIEFLVKNRDVSLQIAVIGYLIRLWD